MENLVTYLTGFAAVAIIGFGKKLIGKGDSKIVEVIKPVQPLIAVGLTAAAPYIANALHLTTQVDPQQVAAAPLATVVAIASAEVLSRLQKKKTQ